MQASSIDDLEYRFQAAINSIHRMTAFCESTQAKEYPVEGLRVRLEGLRESWNEVKEVERLLAGREDIITMASVERRVAETEELFFMACAMLKELQRERDPSEKREGPMAVQVSLPFAQHDVKNTWGEFDGSITKWQGFRDRFVAAIHNNDKIAPAYKFAYLKKSLTGKAARALGEWQLTETNYCEAWQRMNEIYTRKYATCRELLRQFFKLPALQGPAKASELERMSNAKHEAMRQLKAQGVPTEGWDMIIVHVLHEKMDAETSCKWEETRASEFPTLREVCAFLEKRAIAMESVQDCRRREASRPSTSAMALMEVGKSSRILRERTRENAKGCTVCASVAHPIWACPEFLALSLLGRANFVRERKLCQNCLKVGHQAKDCFQGPCARCPGKQFHNSVLCPMREIRKAGAVHRVQEQPRKRAIVKRENEKRKED
ncbi:uncharacterized protein LOC129944931 [Eupeodes corollae]|uniref:uncharacterized protein LOC129944931 n=1 Tax=Eupeodes corollae TaxID=290404 RepID=UPI002493B639|nr:uncharacterized protein LOC129944931 [Eupeodes corollae]